MPNVTVHCPPTGNKTHKVTGGRTYTGVVGTPQLVPDFDADQLEANGWTTVARDGTYTTAARPTTGLKKGMKILDSTIGAIIVYDGATWRNCATGAAV